MAQIIPTDWLNFDDIPDKDGGVAAGSEEFVAVADNFMGVFCKV